MKRRYGLPKSKILRRQSDIHRLFKQGSYLSGKHFDIIYLNHCEQSKVLFGVSRKVKKKVVRNRIKRRLREVYRLNQYEIPEHLHLALIGKPSAAEAPFGELSAQFLSMMNKKRVS